MSRKLFIILCLALAGQTFAQEKSCASIKFQHGNCQIGLKPLTVKRVFGIVLGDYSPNKTEKDSEFPMEDFCVILFREKDEKLVTHTKTSFKGRFELRNIPDGDYRLVVKSTDEHNFGLTVASIPLKIESKANKKKSILVRMVPLRMHSCSYAEIQ